MGNRVRIFALGGLDENGKNMYILEINEDIFILECGMKYPETLSTGVDMIIPDFSYLIKNAKRIKGIFISHGHDDIMASLPYLYDYVKAPIFCTDPTAFQIKQTANRIHKEQNFDIHLVKSGDVLNISGHDLYFFGLTHSIPGCLGIAIETGDGLVVYTSDFIVSYESSKLFRSDLNLVSRIGDKKVLALLSESIASDKEGLTSPNHKLTPLIEQYFSEKKGRIILSIYSQNLYGIQEAIELARKYNYRICIYYNALKESLRNLYESQGKYELAQSIAKAEDFNMINNDDVLIIVGGHGERVFNSLNKIANHDHPNIIFKDSDTIINAAKAVPGLETLASKVIDELYRTGATVVNLNKKLESMHAHKEDLKLMLSLFKPKYYIPVKGDYKNLIYNGQLAISMNAIYNYSNVFVLDNGMVATFIDGNFKGFNEKIPLEETVVDGLVIEKDKSNILIERAKLGEDGILSLGITISSLKREIITNTDIQMRGVIFLKNSDEFIEELVTAFENLVYELIDKKCYNNDFGQMMVNDALLPIVRKRTGKSPLIVANIIDVDK